MSPWTGEYHIRRGPWPVVPPVPPEEELMIHYRYQGFGLVIAPGGKMDVEKSVVAEKDGLVIIGQCKTMPSSALEHLVILVDGIVLHTPIVQKMSTEQPPGPGLGRTLHVVAVSNVTPGIHVVQVQFHNADPVNPATLDHISITVLEGVKKNFEIIPAP